MSIHVMTDLEHKVSPRLLTSPCSKRRLSEQTAQGNSAVSEQTAQGNSATRRRNVCFEPFTIRLAQLI